MVNWQEEVVDPNDVAPVQLELGGREKGQNATFSGLTLRRYGGIRPARFVTAPPVEHVLDVPFDDQVVLNGYKVLNNGDLLLFWQRTAGSKTDSSDLHMSLTTSSLDGQQFAHPADRRLAGYTYPSFRWPEDKIVMGHIPAQDWLGEKPTAAARCSSPCACTMAKTQRRLRCRRLPAHAELQVRPVEVVID